MSSCNLRDYRRLIATPIGSSLLRVDLALDLYAKNPFRILAVPAWLEDEQRDALIQRFRNLYKLRPEAAVKDILRIGYEEFAEIRDHLGLLNDLREPHRRLVWELFWPHVSQTDFNRISAGGVLTIPRRENPPPQSNSTTTTETKDILRIGHERFAEIRNASAPPEASQTPQQPSTETAADLLKTLPVIGSGGHHLPIVGHKEDPEYAAIWIHTLAILHHNRALAIEFSIGTAVNEPAYARLYRIGADEHWKRALDYWAATIANPDFWEYLNKRIAVFDDPQLQSTHLESLREELPTAILAFNATLIRAYVGAGCMEDAARQMRLLGNNLFHLPTQQAIMIGLLREVANAWLNPLIQQLENQHPRRKCTWQEVRDWLEPILESADKLSHEIQEKFGVDETTLTDMQFDNLAERLLAGIGLEVLDNQSSNRRILLFLILMCRRILALPLSPSLQRRIEGMRGEYIESLYGCFYANPYQARSIDPTECWFLPGELSDPESSLLLPVSKMESTKRSGSTLNVQEVLIPRSRFADMLHIGKTPLSSLRDQRQTEVVRLTSMVDGIQNEILRDHQRLEKACTSAIDQENSYWQAQTKAFSKEIVQEETALRTAIERIEESFRPRITEIDARLTAARTTVIERWGPTLKAAQNAVTRLRPINRLARITLPITGIIAAAVALSLSALSAAYAWTFQYITPIELLLRERFYVSDRLVDFLPIVIATILTVILAIALAEIVLSGKARAAKHALEKLERRQGEDFAWIDQVVQKQRDVVLSEQDAQLLDQRVKLAIITKRREDFLHEMNQRVADIQNRHQQERERRQENLNHRLLALKQQLESYQHPPKAADDKSDFPAYIEALRMGYQPGGRLVKQDTKISTKQGMAKLWPF